MNNKLRGGIFGVIILFILGIGIYNPEVRINISDDIVNQEAQKRLPLITKVPQVGLNGSINELDIKFNSDGTASIHFEGDGELTSGTTFSAEAIAISGLVYEEGKIYLSEPWIDEVIDYDYKLDGKEKAVKDAYNKSQKLFNKMTGKEYELRTSVVDKAKDKLATVLEYIPIHDLHKDKSIKGWIISQATGDIYINDGHITAVLYPFGFFLKFIIFSTLTIILAIAAMLKPDFFLLLVRLS